MRDQIYKKKAKFKDFQFNQEVSNVFENMVARSIPDYQFFIHETGLIAKWIFNQAFRLNLSKEGFFVYDLGCSTLSSSLAIDQQIQDKRLKIIAIDNSKPMLKKAKEKLTKKIPKGEIQIKHRDIREIEFHSHHLSVLNFTLQFVDTQSKDKILKSIYSSLKTKGAVIVSEKIRYPKKKKRQLVEMLHYEFKKINGYSEIEIERNLRALKNVLFLESPNKHLKRLRKIGFSEISIVRQSLNFVSIVAIK